MVEATSISSIARKFREKDPLGSSSSHGRKSYMKGAKEINKESDHRRNVIKSSLFSSLGGDEDEIDYLSMTTNSSHHSTKGKRKKLKQTKKSMGENLTRMSASLVGGSSHSKTTKRRGRKTDVLGGNTSWHASSNNDSFSDSQPKRRSRSRSIGRRMSKSLASGLKSTTKESLKEANEILKGRSRHDYDAPLEDSDDESDDYDEFGAEEDEDWETERSSGSKASSSESLLKKGLAFLEGVYDGINNI